VCVMMCGMGVKNNGVPTFAFTEFIPILTTVFVSLFLAELVLSNCEPIAHWWIRKVIIRTSCQAFASYVGQQSLSALPSFATMVPSIPCWSNNRAFPLETWRASNSLLACWTMLP
jgi:hypothetical protein